MAIKKLSAEGWLTFEETRERLGLTSKQGVHHMVWVACEFDEEDIRQVGERIFVVREKAVEQKVREREQWAREREAAKAAAG